MARNQRENLVLLPVPCTPATIREMPRGELPKAIRAGLLPSSRIILDNEDLLRVWMRSKEDQKMGNASAPMTRIEFVRCMEALVNAIEGAYSSAVYSNWDGRV